MIIVNSVCPSNWEIASKVSTAHFSNSIKYLSFKCAVPCCTWLVFLPASDLLAFWAETQTSYSICYSGVLCAPWPHLTAALGDACWRAKLSVVLCLKSNAKRNSVVTNFIKFYRLQILSLCKVTLWKNLIPCLGDG